MNYTSRSVEQCSSARYTDVRYEIRRISFGGRIDLARRIREIGRKAEYLEAGSDVRDKLEATVLTAEIDRAYLEWGLAGVEGLEIDGEAATPASLIDNGPAELAEEILSSHQSRVRVDGRRKKKLVVAFHFQSGNEAAWRCDECRRQGLESRRRCGWLREEQRGPKRIVWARGRVAAEECPKSLVTAQSLEWIEKFLHVRKFAGGGCVRRYAGARCGCVFDFRKRMARWPTGIHLVKLRRCSGDWARAARRGGEQRADATAYYDHATATAIADAQSDSGGYARSEYSGGGSEYEHEGIGRRVDGEQSREHAGECFRVGAQPADFGIGEFVWRRGRQQSTGAAGAVCRAAGGSCERGNQRGECGWRSRWTARMADCLGRCLRRRHRRLRSRCRCRRWTASRFWITATTSRWRCGRRC